MQKSNQLCMCSLLLASVFITFVCNAEQPNPFNEKFEYFQKPMRNLDPQLMDEVLEYAPDEIKDIIDVIDKSDMKESLRVMLVGSPGVGKTTLAQAIALQTGRPCYIVRAPSLSNQFQFSGEQNLIAAINPLFEQKEPCVVIIDEIDALKQYKGDKANQDASPANTLCNLLDDAEDHPHVIFIATTNKLKQIPEDLKSRFGTVVTLPLPDKAARERIIQYHLKELENVDINVALNDDIIEQLASKTEGFSAREIKAMILKGKIKARRAGDVLHEQEIWDAYKAEKPLIGSSWHIKDKLIEFTKEHGVGIALSLAGTAVAIVGIVLSEHRCTESKEHQEQLELEQRRDRLLGSILGQRKMMKDYEIKKDRCELLCCLYTERYYKTKLAKTYVDKKSKEAIYLQAKSRFLVQQVEALHEAHDDCAAIAKENEGYVNEAWKALPWYEGWCIGSYYYESAALYSKTTELVKEELKKQDAELQKKQADYVCRRLAAKLSMNDQELEEFEVHVGDKYEAKIDKKVVLTERSQFACEFNDANAKSVASARERSESRLDRLGMAAAGASVPLVTQGATAAALSLASKGVSKLSGQATVATAPANAAEAPKGVTVGQDTPGPSTSTN
jgi:SpoVK/Ycf46/Vps4 family AAA+-type ATPase